MASKNNCSKFFFAVHFMLVHVVCFLSLCVENVKFMCGKQLRRADRWWEGGRGVPLRSGGRKVVP